VYGLLNDAVNSSGHVAWDGGIISELVTGNDEKVSHLTQFKVLYYNFPGGSQEDHKKHRAE
jgi:hypothetical protein